MLKNSNLTLFPVFVANYSRAFLVILMLFVYDVGAQKNSENFKQITENLIAKSPETYNELETVLNPIERDTSLMRYFANASLNENYYSGVSYALNKLGVSYRDYSLYDKAISLHQQALEVAETNDNIEYYIH